jgi:hypothetical protein
MYLYDPTNEQHKELKYYKNILDESENLIRAKKEMDEKMEITTLKKKPVVDDF